MTEQPLPALSALPGVEQLRHLGHPDHPVQAAAAGAALVDFRAAAEWHDRIHADATAEGYDLGHEHAAT
jgi:hypothetical protein